MKSRTHIPGPVLGYGVAGILPFWGLATAALVFGDWRAAALAGLAAYGALILSFLGGARWGIEAMRAAPRLGVVTLAMVPTLAGWGLVMMPAAMRAAQLAGLALLLAVHLAWDLRAVGLPGWYPRLRAVLTAGAMAGLLAGAVAALD